MYFLWKPDSPSFNRFAGFLFCLFLVLCLFIFSVLRLYLRHHVLLWSFLSLCILLGINGDTLIFLVCADTFECPRLKGLAPKREKRKGEKQKDFLLLTFYGSFKPCGERLTTIREVQQWLLPVFLHLCDPKKLQLTISTQTLNV